jgi:hypothetical protein
MTTEQIDQAQRPLAQVDAAVEQIKSSSREAGSDSPMQALRQAAEQAVRRVTEDARSVAFLGTALIAVISVILVVVSARNLRPQPRSAEDLLLERSREAFDQSREALEAAIAKLGSAIAR